MKYADQREIFVVPPRTPGCIRYEIGKCLGPCVAAPSAATYRDRVLQARAFLDGANDGPIEMLAASMKEASERLEFERAGILRDKRQRLEDLRDRFDRMRFAAESLTFAYPVEGVGGDDRVYLIRRGVVRAELPAPRSRADEKALRDAARRVVDDTPFTTARSIPQHEVDELLVIAAWFRAHPAELERAKPLKAS
jgi:excinuclease UvrABC nuclease subunit